MFPQTSDCNIRIYSFFKQMPQHPMSLIQYISFFDCTLPCKLPNIRHKPSIVKKTSRSGDLYQQLLMRHILHCLHHNKTLPHSLCNPTKPIRHKTSKIARRVLHSGERLQLHPSLRHAFNMVTYSINPKCSIPCIQPINLSNSICVWLAQSLRYPYKVLSFRNQTVYLTMSNT